MSDGLIIVKLGSKAGKMSGKTLRVDPVRAAKWKEIGWLDDGEPRTKVNRSTRWGNPPPDEATENIEEVSD